jgi:hypothetical protein
VRERAKGCLHLADLVADPRNEFILDDDENDDVEVIPEYWYARWLTPEECQAVIWH